MLVPEDPATSSESGPSPGPAPADAKFPWREAFNLALAQAISIVGHHRQQLAEEIAQEAITRMWRRNPEIRETWQALLRTIVANTARNHFRDETTRRKHVCLDLDVAHGAPDNKSSPPDRLVEEETLAELPTLLTEMEQRFDLVTRTIVDLRAQGIPWQEITEIVDLSDRACRYRHQEARDWLCARLSLEKTRGGRRG